MDRAQVRGRPARRSHPTRERSSIPFFTGLSIRPKSRVSVPGVILSYRIGQLQAVCRQLAGLATARGGCIVAFSRALIVTEQQPEQPPRDGSHMKRLIAFVTALLAATSMAFAQAPSGGAGGAGGAGAGAGAGAAASAAVGGVTVATAVAIAAAVAVVAAAASDETTTPAAGTTGTQ